MVNNDFSLERGYQRCFAAIHAPSGAIINCRRQTTSALRYINLQSRTSIAFGIQQRASVVYQRSTAA